MRGCTDRLDLVTGALLAVVVAMVVGGCTARTERPPARSTVSARAPAAMPIRDRFAGGRLDLLREINADRRASGSAPIGLDSVATVVAQFHAESMAGSDFFSHYGLDGGAPYGRMADAGSDAHVKENIFRRQASGVDPYQRSDPWLEFDVREAQQWLMASTGHRETILDPQRTSVGLGIAVNRARGAIVVVQEFIAHYVDLDVPRHVWRRSELPIRGRMRAPGLRPLAIVIRREPVVRPWAERGEAPPGGPYVDGEGSGDVISPWLIAWSPGDRSFEVVLPAGRVPTTGRYYGIVYVAPDRLVGGAIDRRVVSTSEGEPGAAFIIDVF